MVKNKINLSVIIPAYNSECCIVNAINSVLSQNSKDSIKEIIVVNDGSTDKTSSIVNSAIKNNKSKIKIILIEQANKGVSSARNIGIKTAAGNWIALLDADDTWNLDKIEKQIEIIKKHPEIKIIGSNRDNFIKKRGKKITRNLFKLNLIDELWSYWPSTPTVMFYKKAFNELGGYDESKKHAEDGDILLKFASKYGVYYIVDSLIKTANKPAYGHSGLSANNKSMHAGCIDNIKKAYKRNDINLFNYILFSIWENIKYARRIAITKLNKSEVI